MFISFSALTLLKTVTLLLEHVVLIDIVIYYFIRQKINYFLGDIKKNKKTFVFLTDNVFIRTDQFLELSK